MSRVLCTLSMAMLWSFVATGTTIARQPNIVLILADDVGREVLGCYGGTSYKTPNIDRLAAGGTRYRHAYAMPMCHPTRIALLTGQYPFRLGHPKWGTFPRQAERQTLPAMLQRAGYATAIGGKWQLALLKDDLQQPNRMGFDEYCLYGWHEGPWYYQPHVWQDGKLRTDVRERYGPDVICDYMIDFIRRNKNRPFFAFYSMELCHAETNDLKKPAPVGPNGHYDSYSEMVAKMDERVRRVVNALDTLGLRENTLLVFAADNGTPAQTLIDAEGDELIYEPVVSKMGDRQIVGGKGTLTDWGTRVPLIANWPGTIRSGELSDELVDMTDILPSLAEVTDAPLPDNVRLDGRAMVAQAHDSAARRRWVFAEHDGQCFLRTQRWKLYSDGRFYDMDADPDEMSPLALDSFQTDAATAHRVLLRALDDLGYPKPAAKSAR